MVSASLFKYSLREMLVWHILRDVPSSTFFFLLVSRGQDPGPSSEWSFHMILYTYQGWKYLLHKYGQKSKKWNKKCKSKQIMLFLRLFVMNIHCFSEAAFSHWGCQVCALSLLFHRQNLWDWVMRRQQAPQLEKLWGCSGRIHKRLSRNYVSSNCVTASQTTVFIWVFIFRHAE